MVDFNEARKGKPPAVVEEPKVPALADDEFEGVAGAGLETRGADELVTPFLYVLQSNSKPCQVGASEYVEGAKAGMFFNNATKRIYKEVEYVPVDRDYRFVEWTPIAPERGLNGGFVAVHEPDSELVVRLRQEQGKFKALKTDHDTEIVETFEIYAIIGEPGFTIEDSEQVIIPFTSIKISRYKLWYDAARKIRYQTANGLVQPAIYQHRWRLRSVFESKWKPNGAMNVTISLAGDKPIDAFIRKTDPIFITAKAFYEARVAGTATVKADYSKAAQEVSEEEIPF